MLTPKDTTKLLMNSVMDMEPDKIAVETAGGTLADITGSRIQEDNDGNTTLILISSEVDDN